MSVNDDLKNQTTLGAGMSDEEQQRIDRACNPPALVSESQRENSQTTEWDGRPKEPDVEGWHLLRRKKKGFPKDEQLAAWRYVPGAVYQYNGPDVTPWHLENSVWREDHVAWDWEYVGRLVLVPAT